MSATNSFCNAKVPALRTLECSKSLQLCGRPAAPSSPGAKVPMCAADDILLSEPRKVVLPARSVSSFGSPPGLSTSPSGNTANGNLPCHLPWLHWSTQIPSLLHQAGSNGMRSNSTNAMGCSSALGHNSLFDCLEDCGWSVEHGRDAAWLGTSVAKQMAAAAKMCTAATQTESATCFAVGNSGG